MRRQQIWMTLVHLPQQRQCTLVRQDRLPRRFEKLRIARGNRRTERLMEDELPGMQFEQVRDPAIFQVDEAPFSRQTDVFDIDVPRLDADFLGDQPQIIRCALVLDRVFHRGKVERPLQL
ncbi:hypothetical protein D3C81_1767300 [compost metagenome]